MASTTVVITADPVATVAALDAAILALTTPTSTFLAPPTDLGDRVGLFTTPLAMPNPYTGCTFIAIPNQDWRLDIPAVDTIVATIPAGQGSRWSMQTRFGYNLHLIGPSVGLEFPYVEPAAIAYPTNATVTGVGSTTASADQAFSLGELLASFTAGNGYVMTWIPFYVQVLQDVPGFFPGQIVQSLVFRIWNDTNPTTINFPVASWERSRIPLISGDTLTVFDAGLIPIQTTADPLTVRVTVNVTLYNGLQVGEQDFIASVVCSPAFYGLRQG